MLLSIYYKNTDGKFLTFVMYVIQYRQMYFVQYIQYIFLCNYHYNKQIDIFASALKKVSFSFSSQNAAYICYSLGERSNCIYSLPRFLINLRTVYNDSQDEVFMHCLIAFLLNTFFQCFCK